MPLLLITAALIRLQDAGPSLFGQQRVGKDGRIFRMWKFRSMVINAESLGGFSTADRDPRITPIGRFVRRTSLDELPQLFNVLKSEMSLVGPRPIVPAELQKYGLEKSYYLMVRPGMTGLWQVSGRNDVDYETRVYLDAWYVKNWSLWYDLAILFKTVKVVFWRNGAY